MHNLRLFFETLIRLEAFMRERAGAVQIPLCETKTCVSQVKSRYGCDG
jgi:hypothetical protein